MLVACLRVFNREIVLIRVIFFTVIALLNLITITIITVVIEPPGLAEVLVVID